MKFKDDKVILAGLDKNMQPALIAAEKIWSVYGHELVITSGLDGVHSAGSLHYYGRAIDCRSKYFETKDRISTVIRALKQTLGNDFDVIDSGSCIHIEYDPKS